MGGLFVLVVILVLIGYGWKWIRPSARQQLRERLPRLAEAASVATTARRSREKSASRRSPMPSRVLRKLGAWIVGGGYAVGWGMGGGATGFQIGWRHGRENAYARWDNQPIENIDTPRRAQHPTAPAERRQAETPPAAPAQPVKTETPVPAVPFKLHAVPPLRDGVPSNTAQGDQVQTVNTEFTSPGEAVAALNVIKGNLAAENEAAQAAGQRASAAIVDWEAFLGNCAVLGLPAVVMDAAAVAAEASRQRSTAIAMILPHVDAESGAVDKLLQAMNQQLNVADAATAAHGAARDGDFYNG
jgi:hypothetical protein